MHFCVKRKCQISIHLEKALKKIVLSLERSRKVECKQLLRPHAIVLVCFVFWGQTVHPIKTSHSANTMCLLFRLNQHFKLIVAFDIVSDMWGKAKLYYLKVILIDQICGLTIFFMFKQPMFLEMCKLSLTVFLQLAVYSS